MKITPPFILGAVVPLFLCAASLRADQPLGKAADNAIYAQALVNKTLAANPDLIVIGLHAVVPGATGETMFASNLDRIGKKDDDDDIAVATERKTILAPNLKDPSRFEVQVPMKDAGGDIIGAIGLVFRYHAGDNELRLLSRALEIRDGLASQIPSLADLMRPAKL